MPLVGRPQPIQHPDEPGVMFQIRALSGHGLRQAELADTKKKLQLASTAGPALEALGEIEDRVRARVEAVRVERGEPPAGPAAGAYDGYDMDYVIEHGLVEWSGPGFDGVKVTDATRRDLDAVTEAFLFEEIMKRSKLAPGEGRSSSAEPTPPSNMAAAGSPES